MPFPRASLAQREKPKPKQGTVLLFAAVATLAVVFLRGGFFDETSLILPPEQSLRATTTVTTPAAAEQHKRPLKVFPMIHELRAEWNNMGVPPLLQRDARNTRSLVVQVGLDAGDEFFAAVKNGFEVVGIDANPKSFPYVEMLCGPLPNCAVVDPKTTTFPLKREPGMSYIINVAMGSEEGSLDFHLAGPVSSFASLDKFEKDSSIEKVSVPVKRLDSIVDEDVFLMIIDTQGFEHKVLEGAAGIFREHTVRQLLFEVEPIGMQKLGLDLMDTLRMVDDYGFFCFSDRSENDHCNHYGEDAEGYYERFYKNAVPGGKDENGADLPYSFCWDDLMCLNYQKTYTGAIPPLLPYEKDPIVTAK